jgi:hypothetical protein
MQNRGTVAAAHGPPSTLPQQTGVLCLHYVAPVVPYPTAWHESIIKQYFIFNYLGLNIIFSFCPYIYILQEPEPSCRYCLANLEWLPCPLRPPER